MLIYPGATYDEYLTPSASVLVCNDSHTASVEKLRHTREWNIPTVSADWLWISIQTGRKKAFDAYLIRRHSSQKDGDEAAGAQPLVAMDRAHERVPKVVSEKHKNNANNKTSVTNDVRENSENEDTKASDGMDNVPPKPSASTANCSPLKEIPTGVSIGQARSPSRSLSPVKGNSKDPAPAVPAAREESDEFKLPAASSKSKALDLAVSGLLKQVRANSRASSASADTSQQSRSKRRRPLLGRASSYTSTKQTGPFAFSRASSIDTLNEDGCGSGAESLDTDTNNDKPPRTSRGEQSFNSVISSKFDFPGDHPRLFREASREMNEEEEPPAGTQLNYEDPDAVAMREEFMRRAGRGTDKTSGTNQALVVGEVKELEDINGWATGRRTRRGGKTAQANNGIF